MLQRPRLQKRYRFSHRCIRIALEAHSKCKRSVPILSNTAESKREATEDTHTHARTHAPHTYRHAYMQTTIRHNVNQTTIRHSVDQTMMKVCMRCATQRVAATRESKTDSKEYMHEHARARTR